MLHLLCPPSHVVHHDHCYSKQNVDSVLVESSSPKVGYQFCLSSLARTLTVLGWLIQFTNCVCKFCEMVASSCHHTELCPNVLILISRLTIPIPTTVVYIPRSALDLMVSSSFLSSLAESTVEQRSVRKITRLDVWLPSPIQTRHS